MLVHQEREEFAEPTGLASPVVPQIEDDAIDGVIAHRGTDRADDRARRASRSFEVAARAMSEQLPPLDEDHAREVLQELTAIAERVLGSIPAQRAG